MLTQDAIRLGIHPSCKKPEVREETKDYDNMKMNELRKVAKESGLKVPLQITKDELIKKLKGEF